MKTSEVQKPKEGDKKPQALVLSKKNLIQLIEGKKMKHARKYIEQLKNSNPKAQRYIKQVLQEIFCNKKVNSGTAYMYALVFYKNLLVSGQLDYYEDIQFFPVQIHKAILAICQYNQKQQNIKQKGINFFKNFIKIEDLDSLGVAVIIYAMQLLQSMAEWYKQDYFTGEQSHYLKKYNDLIKRGIKFPKKSEYLYIKQQDKNQFQENYLQLFQMPQDATPNHKLKPDTENKSLNKSLPKQENKIVQKSKINTQNISSNQTNINKVIQQKQNFVKNKSSESIVQKAIKNALNESSKLISEGKMPQIKQDQNKTLQHKYQLQKQKKNIIIQENKPIFKIDSNNKNQNISEIKKQVIKSQIQKIQDKDNKKSTLLSEIQKKKVQKQDNIKRQQNAREQGNIKKSPRQQQINKQLINIGRNIQTQKQSINIVNQIQNKNEKVQKKQQQIKGNGNSNVLIKKSLKRIQQGINNRNDNSLISDNRQQESSSYMGQQNSKYLKQYNLIGVKVNNQKRKHKIFETPRSRLNYQINKPKLYTFQNQFKANQTQFINLQNNLAFNNNNNKSINISSNNNILNDNLSFLPRFNNNIKDNTNTNSNIKDNKNSNKQGIQLQQQNKIIKRKSVPKTQKKLLLQRTFTQNQQIISKLGLTQNIYQVTSNQLSLQQNIILNQNNILIKNNKQKFPMKTLSAWRCQKQIKRQYSPQKRQLRYEQLVQLVKRERLIAKNLRFVPQYYEPITLKMYGLRKSSLQIESYSESSQIFYNNGVIEVRLMKPNKYSYILSLLNISRLALNISLVDMRKIQYSKDIKIGNNHMLLNNNNIVVNTGCYLDIPFTFITTNLNFKFLTFQLLINQIILPLQLPITLLDQCHVSNHIHIDTLLHCNKKNYQIIKSQIFNINIKQLPNFILNKNHSQNKFKSYQNNQSKPYQNNEPKSYQNNQQQNFYSFILKIKPSQSEPVSSLNCFLYQKNKNIQTYQLSIIFDSLSQYTQSFSKVMLQLLTFLLYD